MGRRAHRNKTSSSISNNVTSVSTPRVETKPAPRTKTESAPRTKTEPVPRIKAEPAPHVETKPAPHVETKSAPHVETKPVPEEIFYMTENGIDLKAMYPDIQLFENAIKYGVGSWYDLGEKLARIEKTAPKRNIRVIETTEAELRVIRVKEYADKFVAFIRNMPEHKRTFNTLVNVVVTNVEKVPEKYRDDVIDTVCMLIENDKMYIDSPPMRPLPPPEPVASPPEPATAEKYVLVPVHLVPHNELVNTDQAQSVEEYVDECGDEPTVSSLYNIAASFESLHDDDRAKLLNIVARIVGYNAEIQATTNYLKRCVHITCFHHHLRSDFLTVTDGDIMLVDSMRYEDQQRALDVMNNCSKFNAGELPMQEEPKDFWSEHYMAICAGWIAASAAAFAAFY